MVRQVQPLRISKTTPSSSPNKMAAATSRPLSEIGSTERRRNSPSYNQATKKAIVSREASPYTENSSPSSMFKPSPRELWTSKDPMSPSRFDSENSPAPDASPTLSSPRRRPSVERLAQASRVKNSNIFALASKDAYDPMSLPMVERPSANRPLNQSLANNSFTRFDSQKKENKPFRSPNKSNHKRSESQTELPLLTPTKSPASVALPSSPDKQNSPSPTKSSLRASQFGIPGLESLGLDSFDGERAPTPRQAKSVTFHNDPPEVNEYEEQTPEPSVSFASDREGSWDSEDYEDQDVSFERGSSAEPERDDSFDADLENADKTPIVLPGDWSRMSPDEARTDLVDSKDDVFEEGEPTERGLPTRVASDETRPLPPLPAFMQRERSGSGSLTYTAERAAHAARSMPFSPPKRASCSKDEILQMIGKTSITRQERVEPLSEADPTSRSVVVENEEALTVTNLDTGEKVEVQVKETEVEEDSVVGDLSEFTKAPPRISRESILRKVRNSKYDFEDFDDEDDGEGSEFVADDHGDTRPSIAELARMDPDHAIPSRENTREMSDHFQDARMEVTETDEVEDVKVKDEPTDEDAFDMSSIPASTEQQYEAPRSPSHLDDYDRQSSVLRNGRAIVEENEDDSSSRYSSVEPDAECSMIHHARQETMEHEDGKETLQEAMQLLTVKDYGSSEAKEPTKQGIRSTGDFVGLPAYLSTDDFDFGMKDFITPSPPATEEKEQKTAEVPTMPALQPAAEITRKIAPPSAPYIQPDVSPPASPASVIRHDDGPVSPVEEHKAFFDERPQLEVPSVPERIASIKTPGGKLKARPSATPADLMAMAEQRRIVSAEHPMPALSAVKEDESAVARDDASNADGLDEHSEPHAEEGAKSPQKDRRKSRKSGGRMDLSFLDVSTFTIGDEEDEGLGLDEDFDRVIEAQKVSTAPFPPPSFARFHAASQQQEEDLPQSTQVYVSYDSPISPYRPHSRSAGTNGSTRTQKGYLMRQNTKVVVASNRNVSGESGGTAKSASTVEEAAAPTSATGSEAARPSSRGTKSVNSSPRKPSEEQFLKTEPWNGKVRRKSVRVASAQMEARKSEVAPPLPGHESALGVVNEDYATGTSNLEDEVGEGVERGRLFVKVVGVKDLDLPMPKNDRLYFQLTLDNGLHCVTTASLELGTNAPIGQEFELVVLNDLEFQLTLTTNLPPPPQPTPPSSSGSLSSPTKSPAKGQKSSGFARFLSSPKKRAEKERLEREAAQAEERRLQEEDRRKRLSHIPTTWDIIRELVNASDGSFARAYVNLNAHEKECFGRQFTVDVPCYNEWALEKDAQVVNSVRSKRGTNAGPVRRPPYVIGQLQLQLFYVPKPKNASDEDMPKSMSAAVREMKRAGETKDVVHEGHLSQQGGDCTHWRRRLFRLQGTKLTAYHEHTHQKRAVINLSKASRLVDDKRMLTADHSPVKSKGRRKSAFAEEDEAYQYVEEGFRMRFANGETIDFYAESKARKDEWMMALSQVIGKPDASQKAATWTDLVIARERADLRPDSAGSISSPLRGGTSEVKDFGRPAVGQRLKSNNAVTPAMTSKSAPTSPMKGSQPRSAPLPAAAAPASRPKTPPMSPRKGHRSRYVVKSMIF